MEVALIILMMALGIFFIFTSLYLHEKNGILNIYLIYNIISFLLSFKICEIIQININANIAISSLFTSLTYLIMEKTNTKEYKNIIKQTFITNIIISIILLISSFYLGSIEDINSVNMKTIFLENYKILISFPIVTLINQILIFLIYNTIKDIKQPVNIKIILTNLTTLMLESILFYISSYIFDIKFSSMFVLIVCSYLIKVVITSIYTPFISYIIKLKKVKL